MVIQIEQLFRKMRNSESVPENVDYGTVPEYVERFQKMWCCSKKYGTVQKNVEFLKKKSNCPTLRPPKDIRINSVVSSRTVNGIEFKGEQNEMKMKSVRLNDIDWTQKQVHAQQYPLSISPGCHSYKLFNSFHLGDNFLEGTKRNFRPLFGYIDNPTMWPNYITIRQLARSIETHHYMLLLVWVRLEINSIGFRDKF